MPHWDTEIRVLITQWWPGRKGGYEVDQTGRIERQAAHGYVTFLAEDEGIHIQESGGGHCMKYWQIF